MINEIYMKHQLVELTNVNPILSPEGTLYYQEFGRHTELVKNIIEIPWCDEGDIKYFQIQALEPYSEKIITPEKVKYFEGNFIAELKKMKEDSENGTSAETYEQALYNFLKNIRKGNYAGTLFPDVLPEF